MDKFLNKIIFDLDGTLIDTAPDLTAAVNCALTSMSLSLCKTNELRNFVGFGLGAMLGQALSLNNIASDEVKAIIEGKTSMMMDYYYDNICKESKLFSGIKNFLQWASDNKIAMAICSNKPEYLCQKLCHKIGIANYFNIIVGGDTTGYAKPDPKPVLYCLHNLGCDLGKYQDVIMIGDSDIDLFSASAININIKFAVALYGYGPFNVIDRNARKVAYLKHNKLYDFKKFVCWLEHSKDIEFLFKK